MIESFFRSIYKYFRPIRIKGRNNNYHCESRLGRKFSVCVIGNDNDIRIGSDCVLSNTSICVSGNNNRIIVCDKVRFLGPCKIVMQGNAELILGCNSGIRGVEFNLKHARIQVGELCMFSYGIVLRNHDSHRIIDTSTDQVINQPKDIVLGNHVWIGQNATILKGANVGDNSVIGFGSVVTSSCEPGSVLAGVPAKVVKQNVNWDY